ncbi:MAG: ROK family protein [Clostridia bacterium]|nr:ROK family protein [Clostridia bacterium]
MNYCIGVDLGGTNIAAGLVDLNTKSIVSKKSIKTNAPRPCLEISADIAELCREVCRLASVSLSEVAWVGVGVPAIIKDGTVVIAVNLEWYDEPLDKILTELTGRPTFVTNDANAAAYAEAKWGCGAGESSVIAITLGTGVGGGIVLNGKIWEGFNGSAAELGHMVIDANGRWCGCGQRGCLEAYCSATALISEAKRMAKLYRDSYMRTLVAENGGKMNGIIPFTAAKAGDLAARQVVDDYIGYLAIGIANIINVFQPAVVCIGGGISGQGEELMAPLREKLKYISFGTKDKRTKVVVAKFKNDAGIIGAALLGLMED